MQSRFHLAFDALTLLITKATFIGIRLLFLYLAATLLDRTEFGVLALAFTTAEICRYIADWGTDNWSLRMFSHTNWIVAANHLVWVMRLRLISSVVAIVLAWFAVGIIAPHLISLRHAGVVTTAVTSLWLNFGINWLQARSALKPAAMFTLVVGIACAIFLILGKISQNSVDQQFITLILSEIIMAIGVLVFVWRQIGLYGSWRYESPIALNEWLKTVTPIAVATLVALAYSRIDQYFVGQIASPAVLGDYTLAQRTAEPVLFLLAAFASTIYVRVSAFVHAYGVSSAASRYAWRWIGLIGIAAITICLLVGVIFILFALPALSQYKEIMPFLWVALLCTIFRCINLCLTAVIQALGAYNYILRISVINAIVITFAVIVAGSLYGPMGAAVGVCAGEALNTCLQSVSLKNILYKK